MPKIKTSVLVLLNKLGHASTDLLVNRGTLHLSKTRDLFFSGVLKNSNDLV